MLRNKVRLLLMLIVLACLGYAAAKSWQFSRQWREFYAV